MTENILVDGKKLECRYIDVIRKNLCFLKDRVMRIVNL